MTEFDLIISNGIVVTADELGESDIAIKDGKIAKVVARGGLNGCSATKEIDAQGAYVTPGGIDAHVHLEEPPLFGKGSTADNFETGTRSAICGGTTTVIAFAPQKKTEDSLLDALHATHAKAKGNCYADYSFHLLVGNPSERALSEFVTLREEGISSLKIYMTYDALRLHDGQILDVLLESRRQGITTMVHTENHDIIDWMTKQLEKRKLYDPKYHATSHPVAVKHIRDAQTRGLPIYAETCPQYLFLTKKDLDKPEFEGAKCVCSPPPREGEEDHEGIWEGLVDGTFTILSSDHCPFRFDDAITGKKTVLSDEFPNGHFKYIPNGCPGVETRMSLMLCAERLEMKRFVELTAANPAKLYGMYPQKGALEPGKSDADLVIWYPLGKMPEFELENEMLHHNVDYSPYEGRKFTQWPRYTILRGQIVWNRDDGGLVGQKGCGKFLKRGASTLAGSREGGEWDIKGF